MINKLLVIGHQVSSFSVHHIVFTAVRVVVIVIILFISARIIKFRVRKILIIFVFLFVTFLISCCLLTSFIELLSRFGYLFLSFSDQTTFKVELLFFEITLLLLKIYFELRKARLVVTLELYFTGVALCVEVSLTSFNICKGVNAIYFFATWLSFMFVVRLVTELPANRPHLEVKWNLHRYHCRHCHYRLCLRHDHAWVVDLHHR